MSEQSRRTAARLGVLLALVLLSLLLLVLALRWEPDAGTGHAASVAAEEAGHAGDPVDTAGTTPARRPERVRVKVLPAGSSRESAANAEVVIAPPPPVTRTVDVTVTDDADVPIAGAVVQVRHNNPAYAFDDTRWRWKQTTDRVGVATIDMPMPGYYEVRATAGDRACLPVALDLSTTESTAVTLAIRPAAVLTGVVRERGGAAVDGARVTLSCTEQGGRGRNIVGSTAEHGTFTVVGVPVECLHLIEAVVSIPRRKDHTFRFRREDLPAPPHLDLRLTDVWVRGRVVDVEGRPIAGVQLQFGRFMRTTTKAGRDGSFAVLLVEGDATHVIVHASPRASRGIPLPAPDATGSVDMGYIVISDGKPLEGWVVDSTGRAATGVNVGLHVFADNGALAGAASVDERGHFRFEHVGNGPHRISVSPAAQRIVSMPAVLDGVLAGETGVRIVLPEYGIVELVSSDESKLPRGANRALTVTLFEPGTETSRGDLDVYGQTGQAFAAPVGVYDVRVQSTSFRDVVVPGVQIRTGTATRTRLPIEVDVADR